MKKFIGICLLFFMTLCLSLCLSAAKQAQTDAPVLVGKLGGKEKSLELQKLDIDVSISGFISETRMTMTFYNPHDRELVGDLHFPLPEGAFVSGYALDINGKMIDGVVVEKTKGRAVFDDIVRRGIDPGLVEWVKGNNFKTSVYPIFAKKSRTVMVRFVSELKNEDGKHYYYLPLKYNLRVKAFSLKVELASGENEGIWKKQRVARTVKKDYLLNRDMNVPLPEKGGNLAIEANEDGEYYFCFKDLEPMSHDMPKRPLIRPKRITLLWDTSKSRGNTKMVLHRELKILERYFFGLEDKRVSVDLYTFNIFKRKIGRFTITNGEAGALIRAIKELPYDGGTNMSAITSGKKGRRPGLYLLFTDGNHNFGNEIPGIFNAPLYIISAAATSNHPLLHQVASRNNGQYINLNRLAQSDALDTIGRSAYSLISVDAPRDALAETFPKEGSTINRDFVFTGKLLKDNANVTLNYGYRGKILKKVKFSLSRKDAVRGNALRTFWAQKKIRGLTAFSKTYWKELIQHGKTYGLVTPGTSLIVLETLDDYLRYRIRPPETLPEMRKEWDEDIGDDDFFNLETAMKRTKQEYLDDIVEDWEDLVKWWKKKFRFPSKKKSTKKGSPGGGAISTAPPAGQSRQQNRRRTDRGPVEFNAQRDIVRSGIDSHARSGVADIQGKIILEDGSVMPGVMITATSPVLNNKMTTVSNERGVFRFIGLTPGSYDITFHLEGLRTCIWRNIPLSRGQYIKLRPLVMETGKLLEETVVYGASPTVDVRYSRVGINVDENVLKHLPVSESSNGSDASVTIRAWDPDSPYMKKIKSAKKSSVYQVYLKQRKEYGNIPGFYLDCANYFFKMGKKQTNIDTGLIILSNLAELNLENPFIQRILAYRLMQLEHLAESERILEVVKASRPQDPQSYRDLALVRERLGKYKSAADLLYKVALIEWHSRFDGIDMVALVELNHVLDRALKKGVNIKKWGIDERLIKLLDVDIRIVMTWDSDGADMDLWVIEPTGEKCYYNNDRTRIGGRLSDDFTSGLGPEEYMIHRAMPGKYIIKTNYFGSGSGDLMAPVTVQVDVFTNYGRKNEKRQSLTLRLANSSDVYLIGEIEFK